MPKNNHLKTVAILLLACLFFQDIAYAQPDLKALKIDFSGRLNLLWAKNLLPEFPESVAVVNRAYRAPNSKQTVIVLCDAHTNTSAQLNTAKILDLIFKKMSARYVFLEAGYGNESLSHLRRYSSLAVRQQVAKSYLLKGQLQGSEYLDLTSDHEFHLWGIEDMALYLQSLETYKGIAGKRQDFENYLERIRSSAEHLKLKIFNPLLLSLDSLRNQFLETKLSETTYMQSLVQQAHALNLSLEAYPNLRRLRELNAIETTLDFKAVQEQAKKAFQQLKAANPNEFSESRFDLHTPKAAFKQLEDGLGHQLSDYPELGRYLAYIRLSEKTEAAGLLTEMETLESALFEILAQTPEEKNLNQASRNVEKLKNLLLLKLSPEEFQIYQSQKNNFDIRWVTGVLNKQIMELQGPYEKAVFLENGYEEVIAQCERFYELTYQRDSRFLENALSKMRESGEREAVMIVGGYHSTNLEHLFKKNGVSYIIVTPQVYQETDQKRYERLLTSQNTQNVFSNATSSGASLMQMNMRIETYDPWLSRAQFHQDLKWSGARFAQEIPVTVDSMEKTFIGTGKHVADKIKATLPEPKGKIGDSYQDEARGITYFLRESKKRGRFFWVFLRSQLSTVKQAFSLRYRVKQIRQDIPELGKDEIAVSHPGLNKVFAGLLGVDVNAIRSTLPLAELSDENAYFDAQRNLSYVLRRSRSRILWAFSSSQTDKVAKAFDFTKRNRPLRADVSAIAGDELSVSIKTFEKLLVGNPQRLRDELKLPDAETSQTQDYFHSTANLRFVLRKTGAHVVWAFKQSEIKKIANALKTIKKNEVPFVKADEIPVSYSGFVKVFIGDTNDLLRIFLAGLPSVEEHVSKSFYKDSRTGAQYSVRRTRLGDVVFAFKNTDREKIAHALGFQLRGEAPTVRRGLKVRLPVELTKLFAGRRDDVLAKVEPHFPDPSTVVGFCLVKGIRFFIQRNHRAITWGFDVADTQKVAEAFGLRIRQEDVGHLGSNEIAVSISGLSKIVFRASDELLAAVLKDLPPLSGKAQSVSVHGIPFVKRLSRVHTVWAFSRTKADEFASAYGVPIRKIPAPDDIPKIKKGEIAVTQNGISSTYVFSQDLYQKMRAVLPDITKTERTTFEYRNIQFFIRIVGKKTMWAFSQSQVEAVASEFGFKIHDREPLKLDVLKPNEIAITQSPQAPASMAAGLRTLKFPPRFFPDDEKTQGKKTLTLRGSGVEVTFTRRRDDRLVVWAVRHEDLAKVRKLLASGSVEVVGARLASAMNVNLLASDEAAVSGGGLNELFVGSAQALAKNLNDALGDPKKSSVDTKKYRNVTYFLRRHFKRYIVWAFKISQKNQVAEDFNLTTRENLGKLEDLGSDQIPVSLAGLEPIYLGSYRSFQQISQVLGSPKQATSVVTRYKGVSFFLRKSGAGATWAFRKRDSEKVAKIFDLTFRKKINPMMENETSVSGVNLDLLFKQAGKISAKTINDALGDPKESTETEIEFKKIRFYLRVSGSMTVWAFKTADKDALAQAFGFDIRSIPPKKTLEMLDPNEVAVSGPSLRSVFIGHGASLNRLIHKALGRPTEALEDVKEYKGVTYTVRKSAKQTVWSFPASDRENVRKSFDLKLRGVPKKVNLPAVATDELAVTIQELQPFVRNVAKVVCLIRHHLGDPAQYQSKSKTYRRVTYFLRRSGQHVIWAFKFSDKDNVFLDFGFKVRNKIEKISSDEIPVSFRSFFKIFTGGAATIAAAVKKINTELGLQDSLEKSKSYLGIDFVSRETSRNTVWAFAASQTERVARAFGFELRDELKEVQPDEMAFFSAPAKAETLARQGIRRSLKSQKKLLSDPAATDEKTLTVQKNGVTVIFIKRKENNVPVWVFKTEDLPKVLKLQGARLTKKMDVPSLQDDEIAVTQKGLVMFIGQAHRLACQVQAKLPNDLKNHIGQSFKIAGLAVQFYVRLKGGLIWVFKLSDVEKVGRHFGFHLKDEIIGVQKNEIAVSAEPLFKVFVGTPGELAKKIKSKLPGLKKEESGLHYPLAGVVYTKRRNAGILVWTFVDSDTEKVAKNFGLLVKKPSHPLGANEIPVSQKGLSDKFASSAKLLKLLQRKLPDPYRSPEDEFSYKGISFVKRQSAGTKVWAFASSQTQKIAKRLEWALKTDLMPLNENEIVVSAPGLSRHVLGGPRAAVLLKEKLPDLDDNTQYSAVFGGVVYTKRRSGIQTVWAFAKTDIVKVTESLQLTSREGIPNLQSEEVAVTSKGLFKIYAGDPKQLVEKFGELPDPARNDADQIVARGTVFKKRKNRVGLIVWAFEKAQSVKAGNAFGLNIRKNIPRVGSGEVVVSQNGLSRVYSGTMNKLVATIEAVLPKVQLESPDFFDYKGIRFEKRRYGAPVVWIFRGSDAANVAEIFGFQFKVDLPGVKEDEIIVSERGLFEVFVGTPKPLCAKLNEKLPDPAACKEDVVQLGGVTYYRRWAVTEIVWTFKKTETTKVADLFGVKVRPAVDEKITERHIAVVSSELDKYFVNGGRRFQDLKPSFPDPVTSDTNDFELGGIRFTRRKKGWSTIWSFEVGDAEKFAQVFGWHLRHRLDDVHADEIIVAISPKTPVELKLTGIKAFVKMQALIPEDPEASKKISIILESGKLRVQFVRRSYQGAAVWAFKQEDLAKVMVLQKSEKVSIVEAEGARLAKRKVSTSDSPADPNVKGIISNKIKAVYEALEQKMFDPGTSMLIGDVSVFLEDKQFLDTSFPLPGGLKQRFDLGAGNNLTNISLTLLTFEEHVDSRVFFAFRYSREKGKSGDAIFYWDATQACLMPYVFQKVKEKKKTVFETAVDLFQKYNCLDLAVALSTNPEEMKQALVILLTEQGVEIKEQEFAELSKSFILNLREGQVPPGSKGYLPGNSFDYLRALMSLQDEIQKLGQHEQYVLIRAFMRLAFPRFAKDFQGAMREMKETLGGADDKNEFLKGLVAHVTETLGKGLRYQPKHIKTELLPHQRIGAWYLRSSEKNREEGIYGFLLEDDTRMGKTIQSYAAMDPKWKAVIAVPASIMDTWAEQFYQHTDGSMKLVFVKGSPEKKRRLLQEHKNQKGVILLTSLEDLRGKTDEEFACLNEGLDLLVVDEGQRIENYGGRELRSSSLQARAIHRLNAPRRWILSASPYTSHPRQLFSVFNLLHTNPKTGECTNPLYASRREFNKLLTSGMRQMRWLYALKARIGLRRTKQEMGGLYSRKKEIDPKEEGAFEISPEQSHLVIKIIRNLGEYIKAYNERAPEEERFSPRSVSIFLKLQFLSWALTDPSILGETVPTTYWDAMDKIVEKRLAQKKPGSIFAQNTAIIDKIVERYKAKGYRVARIDGTITGDAIVDGKIVVDANGNPMSAQAYQRHLFQTGQADVMVMNVRAGIGLDLSAACWELYAQLPQNYVEYYQSSDRALGLNPPGTKKEVEVLFMIGKHSQAFLDEAMKSQDKVYVEHGSPAEIYYAGIMGEDKARFELVMEGIQAERNVTDQKALTRLVHAIHGFLEDPSMKLSKKHRKAMKATSSFYPLFQRVKGNKSYEEEVLELVEFFSKTEIGPQALGKAIGQRESFQPEDLKWINALEEIPNKYQRDRILGVAAEILERTWKEHSGLNELVERGPPAYHYLAEAQPELVVPVFAALHAWSTRTNEEGELEPSHAGAMTLLEILEEFYTDGLSEYDRSHWVRRYVSALILLIDLDNEALLDCVARLQSDLLSGRFSIQEKIEFFEEMGVLRSADPKTFQDILSMPGDFTAAKEAAGKAVKNAVIQLFELPDTPRTHERLMELARQWGSLQAPLQLMVKLQSGTADIYTDHVALFKRTFRHIVDGTYPQWRNEQSLDRTGHEIHYREDDPAFWKVFTREEHEIIGDITVNPQDYKKTRRQKISLLLDRFTDESALTEAFGPTAGPKIYRDFSNAQAETELAALKKQKGNQRGALEKAKAAGKEVDAAIAVLNQELEEIALRQKLQAFTKALRTDSVKDIQRNLPEIYRAVNEPADDEVDDAALHLKVSLRELAQTLEQTEKPREFEEVEVEITSNPDLIMRRGMLHEELKNCFNLHGGVKQVASLVDDLVSRNKMLAIVRSKGRIASVAIIKVRKTEDGKPVLMIERPLYRWGYSFERQIADVLAKTKLPFMKDAVVAGDTYKGEAKDGHHFTVFTTGTRAREEYHETLWGLRNRESAVSHLAGLLVGAQSGARLANVTQIQKIKKGEIVVSGDGLKSIFFGVPKKVSARFRAVLPNPKIFGESQTTHKGVVYFMRRSANHLVWVFTATDTEKVAKALGFVMRDGKKVPKEFSVIASPRHLSGRFVSPVKAFKALRNYLPDPETYPDELFVKDGMPFHKVFIRGRSHILWAFKEKDISRIAEKLKLVTTEHAPRIGKNEIPVSPSGMPQVFVGHGDLRAKNILEKLPNIKEHPENTFIFKGIKFFKRTNLPWVVWAFKAADKEKVAKAFGFKISETKKPLQPTEISVSNKSFRTLFVGNSADRIKSALPDVDDFKEEFYIIPGLPTVRFYPRDSIAHRVWAFNVKDKGAVAAYFGHSLKKAMLPLQDGEAAISPSGLLPLFVGDPREYGNRIRALLPADPRNFDKPTFEIPGLPKVKFFVRDRGAQAVWSFYLADKDKIGAFFGFPVRKAIPSVADGEIAVSAGGLSKVFVGDPQLSLKKILTLLPEDPENFAGSEYRIPGLSVAFFCRQNVQKMIWTFSQADSKKIADYLGFQLRNGKDFKELQADETPVSKTGVAPLFRGEATGVVKVISAALPKGSPFDYAQPDFRVPGLEEVQFFIRKTQSNYIWAFKTEHSARVAEFFNLNLRKPISAISKDEIGVSIKGLLTVYIGQVGMAKKIQAALPGDPETFEGESCSIPGLTGVDFYIRQSGASIVWAFDVLHAKKVARHFGLNLVSEIPKISENEISITGPTFGRLFVGQVMRLTQVIQSKLPNAYSYPKNTYQRGDVRYSKRRNKAKIVWVAEKKDIQKIADDFGVELRNDFKEIMPDEMVLGQSPESPTHFGGKGVKQALQWSTFEALRDRKLSRVETATLVGDAAIEVIFTQRIHEGLPVWTFKQADLTKVQKLHKSQNVMVKGARLAVELEADEIPVSIKGLSKIYVGNGQLLDRRFDKELPDPRTYREDKFVLGEVVFYKRQRQSKIVWAFKKSDRQKVAVHFGLKFKRQVSALSKDEIAVTAFSLSNVFIGTGSQLIKKFRPFLPQDALKNAGKTISKDGVNYFVRKTGVRIVYAFNKADLPTVSKNLGVTLRKNATPLQSGEIAVTQPGLNGRFVGDAGAFLERFNQVLPDALEYDGVSVTVRDVVFNLRKSGKHVFWSFDEQDTPKVLAAFPALPKDEAKPSEGREKHEALRGSVRRKLFSPELGFDEIGISIEEMSKEFIGNENVYVRKVRAALPPVGSEETCQVGNIDYYKRKRGGREIWAFKREDKPKVTAYFGLTPRIALVPIRAGEEIPVSNRGLCSVFIGMGQKLIGIVRPQLPDVRNFSGDMVVCQGVEFYKRTKEYNLIWAFKLSDKARVAHAFGLKLKDRILPILSTETAVSSPSLGEVFVGDPKFLARTVKSALPVIASEENEFVLGDVTFRKRLNGKQTVWCYAKVDTEKVRRHFRFAVRERLPSEPQILVSEAGLSSVFLGNAALFQTVLAELPDARTFQEDSVMLGGVQFSVKIARPNFFWIFPAADKAEVARHFGFQLKDSLEEAHEDEIAVHKSGLEALFIGNSESEDFKRFMDRLPNPLKSQETVTVLDEVRYQKRRVGNQVCWAFKKADFEKFSRSAGLTRRQILKPLQPGEIFVGGDALIPVFFGVGEVNSRIILARLPNSMRYELETYDLENVRFVRRKNGSKGKISWAFDRQQTKAIALIFGLRVKEQLLELQADEIALTQSPANPVALKISGSKKSLSKISDWLPDPQQFSKDSVILEENGVKVQFTRRFSGVAVWAIRQEDLGLVAKLLKSAKNPIAGARLADVQGNLFEPTPPSKKSEPSSVDLTAEGITKVAFKIGGKPHEVYGIGHSNRPIEKFIELLQKAGIKTVVDVRTRPLSRFCPHFNRGRLEPALKAKGIGYIWQGDKLGGKVPEFGGDFGKYMEANPDNSFKKGILELLRNVQKSPAAVGLLCSEKALDQCHRRQILDYLEKTDFSRVTGARLAETPVTKAMAKWFVCTAQALAKEMNGILGDAKQFGAGTKTYAGVTYIVRKKGPHTFWAFNNKDKEKISRRFRVPLREIPIRRELERPHDDETMVTTESCVLFEGSREVIAQKINQALGDPKQFAGNFKDLHEIRFYLRRSGPNIIWTFKTTDKEKVASVFALVLRPDFKQPSGSEGVVSKKSIGDSFVGDSNKITNDIHKVLGDPKNAQVSIQVHEGVSYHLRRRDTGHLVWTYPKKDSAKVAKSFGLVERQRQRLRLSPAHQIAVSQPSFKKYFDGNMTKVTKQLNDTLGDPNTSEVDQKNHQGVVYSLRKRGVMVWAFPVSDKERVAQQFGLHILEKPRPQRLPLEAVQPNEIAVTFPGMEPHFLSPQKVVHIVNTALGLPKLSEANFQRRDGVTFYLRRSHKAVVWAFPRKDGARVANIFGLILRHRLAVLQSDEVAVFGSPDSPVQLKVGGLPFALKNRGLHFLENPQISIQESIVRRTEDGGEITFVRRNENGLPVWAVKLGDLPKIKKVIGARLAGSALERRQIRFAAQVYDKTRKQGSIAILNAANQAETMEIASGGQARSLVIRLTPKKNVRLGNYKPVIRQNRLMPATPPALKTPKVLELHLAGFMNENTKLTDALFVDWLIQAMQKASQENALMVIRGSEEQQTRILKRARQLYPRERFIYPNAETLPVSHGAANKVTVVSMDPEKTSELPAGGLYWIAQASRTGALHNISQLIRAATAEAELGFDKMKAGTMEFEQFRKLCEELGIDVGENPEAFADFLKGKGVTLATVRRWGFDATRLDRAFQAYMLGIRMVARAS